MEKPYQQKLIWTNILWFGMTALIAIVGLPIFIWRKGLVPADWYLFTFMSVVTMMATTFGYHRLFAHRTFKANRFMIFLSLFFGAGAFEGSAAEWASQHRIHHKYIDTERDPYNVKQGFWHAHMGWFLFHQHEHDFENVKDLTTDALVMNQHKYWGLWAWGAGILFPLFVGLLYGNFWGAFFLAVAGRLVFISQSVFLINSACHYFGKPTYDPTSSAKDSWICALVTHGEGYHSFHHRFPSDYRNGIQWYHWDPTKWFIRFLSWFGCTWDLKTVPLSSIEAARTAALRQKLPLAS